MFRTLDQQKTGFRIKQMCMERQIDVERIVTKLNVSRQTVYGWFSAKKLPSLDHLVELVDLLDVQIDDLVVRTYINDE